jgi:hypothetical protein
LSAQAAMDVQSSIARSHGLPWSGQQSCIGSETSISADFMVNAKPLAIGSNATDNAITRANIVRPIRIDKPYRAKIIGACVPLVK